MEFTYPLENVVGLLMYHLKGPRSSVYSDLHIKWSWGMSVFLNQGLYSFEY